MAAYFLDSSALIKRYVQEQGTQWVRRTTEPGSGHQLFVARHAILESAATLLRQARAGNVEAQEASAAVTHLRQAFAHEWRVIEITPLLASHALNHIQKHSLRGSDALHLAAATELRRRRVRDGLSDLTFVCADEELNGAARTEGLLVENPNAFA